MLSTKQLREWRAYYRLEPWGEESTDLQHAYTRKIIAEVFGGKKKAGKAFSIYDLSFDKLRVEERDRRRGTGLTKPQQSVEDMKQILKGIHGISQANKGQVSPAQKARQMKSRKPTRGKR